MFLDTVIQSQQEEDIRQTLLDVTIGFAESDEQVKLLYQWFKQGFVTDTKGNKFDNVELKLKAKHSIT